MKDIILFKEDWHDADGKLNAYIHRSTNNKTFLRISALYKKMGIENCMFPLAITQPVLAKFDPHNLKDDSAELRMLIAHECEVNPWYFLREVVRIPVTGAPRGLPFQAHRGNMALCWSYFNSVPYIGVQPRQTGKAQPLDAKIKVPGGWTTMGDVRIGDVLNMPDGSEAPVIGVFPQGVKPVYEVRFIDGRKVRCCAQHLWKVRLGCSDTYETLTLTDLMDKARLDKVAYVPGIIPDKTQLIAFKNLLNANGMSDGFVETSNLELVEKLVETTRALGGRCLHTTLNNTHQLKITLPEPDGPPLELSISSVEYVGEEPVQCIEVDHPEHLYITDDYVVTHNTIGVTALMCWVLYLKGRKFQIGMLTKDDKLRIDNVARIKGMRDLLPEYLVLKSVKDIDNKQGLMHAALENEYKTFVGPSDRQAADNIGRGATLPSIHVDEKAFIKNLDIIFSALMPATTAAARIAKANDMPHSNIYTTTAGKTDTPTGAYSHSMLLNAMPFTEKLYDVKDHAELIEMIDKNSLNGVINGTFSHLQLGFDNTWLDTNIKQMQNPSKDVIDRELLNIWSAGTQSSILTPEVISNLKAHEQSDPNWVEVLNHGYTLKWYVPRDVAQSKSFKEKSLIMSLDSSEQIARDFTTVTILDPSSLKTVATLRCNESNVIKIADAIGDLLITYKKTIFIPERKSTGASIIDHVILKLIQHGFNPLRRIFNGYAQEGIRQAPPVTINGRNTPISEVPVREIEHNGTIRKKFGFMTTGDRRTKLYKEILNKAVDAASDRILDPIIISELGTLSVVNGRVDHSASNHDDAVISWLIGCWLIFEGRNFGDYDFDASCVLKEISVKRDSSELMQVDDRDHILKQLTELELEHTRLEQAMQAAGSNVLLKSKLRRTLSHIRQQRDLLKSKYKINVDDSLMKLSTERARELVRQERSGVARHSPMVHAYHNPDQLLSTMTAQVR